METHKKIYIIDKIQKAGKIYLLQ